MTSEVFKQIFTQLQNSTNNKSSFVILDRENLPINKTYFNNNFTNTTKKIAFVDGGNGELLSAPNFSLQFIRIYASIFKDNKRIHSETQEFYATIATSKKENKIVYETKTFDSNQNISHTFELNDNTLTTNNHAVSPSATGEAIRKFAELKMLTKIANILDSEDTLVRDGELFGRITFEQKYLDNLFSTVKNKNIALCGFSKTTTLLTDTGNSAVAALNSFGENAPWYYFPPQNSSIKTGFVKLSPRTKYIFRIDLFNDCNTREIISLLWKNSQDPSFLGYPYGLIHADARARVTKQECAMLKLQFMTKFGEPFKQHSASLDAHDVLNVIK